ncbi:MAG: ABC transporter permease subunit [Myxococcota bacterium]
MLRGFGTDHARKLAVSSTKSMTGHLLGGAGGLLRAVDGAGTELRSYPGHAASVWAVAVGPTSVVSAASDGSILVHPRAGGEATATVPGSGRPVRKLVWLPDGASFLAVSDAGWVRRYAPTGEVLHEFPGHGSGTTALALSPDGASFWTGGRDRALIRWDLATGEPSVKVEAHDGAVVDLAFDPAGGRLATGSDDRSARVFPVVATGLGDPVVLEGHTDGVTAVAWLGDRLFTGSRDESVRQWDPATGAQVGQLPTSIGVVHDLAPSLDGTSVWVGADAWSVVPLPVRYVKWLARTLTLDFDRSFVDNELVLHKIGDALPTTLMLNLMAIFVIYTISVPLGILAAVYRGSRFDRVSSLVVFVLYSMPSFWVATLLILTFSSVRVFDWFPSVGLHAQDVRDYTGLQVIGDTVWHLVLPMTALVYGGFASLSRYVRTSMLEVIQADFVRTARAKGLSEWVVVINHAFRNALVVIVTLIGNLLPAMIGGSVIIEYIFNIQGMGLLAFNAILSRDYPVVMATTTLSALLTLLGILVSDLLYGVVDPRVRIEK